MRVSKPIPTAAMISFGFAICAVVGVARASEYRCSDPKAEQIRRALGIDRAGGERIIDSCIAREWQEPATGSKGLWILGIVERAVPSAIDDEYVFRFFVAREEGKGFVFVRRAVPFRVLWPQPPHWKQSIVGIETVGYTSPRGWPAFGIRLRADFAFKMEARWEERLVLFAMDDQGLDPFFSTTIRKCNCAASREETYPTPCFEQPACPGVELAATLVQKQKDKRQPYTLTKVIPEKRISLEYTWVSVDREGLYLDPLEEPLGRGVEFCE
jgi:hypothetical protein